MSVSSNEEDSKDLESDCAKDKIFRDVVNLSRERGEFNVGQAIYFSRHGESTYNVENRIGGDPLLTERGSSYAVRLGEFFKNRYSSSDSYRVFTSALKRTILTAGHLKSDQERSSLLNELQSGRFDGLTYDEFRRKFPDEYRKREADKYRYCYPVGGESYRDCCRRIEPLLNEIEKHRVERPNQDLIIIAHQGVLRCFLGYLRIDEIKPEDIPYIEIPQHKLVKVVQDSSGRNHIQIIDL